MSYLYVLIRKGPDMLHSHIKNANREIGKKDPMPRLHAATEKLRLYADSHDEILNSEARHLLEDALLAAAETEHNIAMQRARLRYLENLTLTDELTGLLNRRGFEQELSRTLARARRMDEKGLLILSDLNNFKAVNDTHGHPAGDTVLVGFAKILRSQTRQTDYVARIGGDEFAVLMTHTTIERASQRWAEVERTINQHAVLWHGVQLPLSASFGSEPYGSESQPGPLLFIADKNLYRNKKPRLVHDAGKP